jgi:hypothetical protein
MKHPGLHNMEVQEPVMEAVPKDVEAVPKDVEEVPEDGEAVPEDGEAVPEDGEAVPVPVPMAGELLMFEYINFTSRSGQCQIRLLFVVVVAGPSSCVSEKIIYIKSYDYWLFGNITLVSKFTGMRSFMLSHI